MTNPEHTFLYSVRQKFEAYQPQGQVQRWLWEFLLFGIKQAWACLFGGVLLFLLITTKYFWPEHMPLTRYDFLFISALTIQIILIVTRMETMEEAKVILVFHVVGTVMELFKTSVGSWSYPEASIFHIGSVPLFSGFMYASVGSYIARITRIFNMRYTEHPSRLMLFCMCSLIYLNFFTHHYLPVMCVFLFLMVGAAFGRTWVYFTPSQIERRMPLLVGFMLVSLFIWIGENVGTLTTTWLYPSQRHGWSLVSFDKFGSWFLLMIISFSLVSLVHTSKSKTRQ